MKLKVIAKGAGGESVDERELDPDVVGVTVTMTADGTGSRLQVDFTRRAVAPVAAETCPTCPREHRRPFAPVLPFPGGRPTFRDADGHFVCEAWWTLPGRQVVPGVPPPAPVASSWRCSGVGCSTMITSGGYCSHACFATERNPDGSLKAARPGPYSGT